VRGCVCVCVCVRVCEVVCACLAVGERDRERERERESAKAIESLLPSLSAQEHLSNVMYTVKLQKLREMQCN